MPLVRATSPLVARDVQATRGEKAATIQVLGVRPAYQDILRLAVDRGRFLAATDERTLAHARVLDASTARQLFGSVDPIGDHVRLGPDHYRVVGVLREHGHDHRTGGAIAWHDLNRAAFVPFRS